MAPETVSVNIFLSYAHQDEELKKRLLDHFHQWIRQGLINIWDDQKISAGSIVDDEVFKHFNEADIILCLLSPDFMVSTLCYHLGVECALERKRTGKSEVVPILVREVEWRDTPLYGLQVLPRDGKSIGSRSNRDRIFKNVVQEIGTIIDLQRSKKFFGKNK